MKIIRIIFIYFPCFLVAAPLWAQSLENKISIDKHLDLAYSIKNKNPDSAMLLLEEVWAASGNIGYTKGIDLSLAYKGLFFRDQKQLDSAIYYFQQSLKFRQKNNLSPSGNASMYTYIGNTYGDKSMFERSIANLKEALEIRKTLNNPGRVADAHSDLAIAYKNLAISKLRANDTISIKKDQNSATQNFRKALEIHTQQKKYSTFAYVCNMISSVYRMEKKYDSALVYLNQAEIILDSLYRESTTKDSIYHMDALAETYNYKGWVLTESDQAKFGITFLDKALDLNRKISDTLGIYISLINTGDNALKLKNYPKALKFFEEARILNERMKFDKQRQTILYNNLATVYDSLGRSSEAIKYLYERIKLNDEISLESSQARLEDATENIKLEADIETTKREKEFQTRLNWFLSIGAVIVTALLSIILWNSNQKRKFQKIIIENQEATHMNRLLSQLEEAEQQILSDQSAKQQMLLTAIGKELHDSIGSMLSAAKREMENLRNSLKDIPEKAEGQFDHSYGMVDKAIRDLRKISKSPDKLSLDEQLVPSLRELCKNINRIENSPQIELNTYRLEGVKLPAKHELHIFRIIQEAITNIIKHAQATEVHMQLDWANRILSITIEDNGKGFDPKLIKHGVGLDSMRSRTEELNGTFTLDTAPGKGSTLFMEISIPG